MIVHDVVQRSDAWRALRVGRLCGSKVADVFRTTTSGYSKTRANLLTALVLERITGRSQESTYQSAAMQTGTEREDAALAAFEDLSGKLLRSIGFVAHDTLMAGYSPDGVLGEFDAIVEAKAPIPATHLSYLKTGVVPLDYMRQITHGLWLTGAKSAIFVSFCPDFPEPGHLKIVHVPRDERVIAAHEREVRTFLAEVDTEEQALRTLLNLRSTLEAAAGAA